jgi:hypothetical protein
VRLVGAFCAFGMIVSPYTMLVVAADARIRVMIDPIVIRWSSIAMSWYIHNPILCILSFLYVYNGVNLIL